MTDFTLRSGATIPVEELERFVQEYQRLLQSNTATQIASMTRVYPTLTQDL